MYGGGGGFQQSHQQHQQNPFEQGFNFGQHQSQQRQRNPFEQQRYGNPYEQHRGRASGWDNAYRDNDVFAKFFEEQMRGVC